MPKLVDKALRPLTVEKLKPKTKRYDVFDAAVRGLGVRIATSGIKTWFVMRRVNGRMVRHTLGRYPEMGLSDARQGAAPLLEDMARGQLPSRGGDGELFDAVFEEWLIRDQGQHRSRKTVEGALRLHVLPYLRGQPIETIRKKDILRVLDAVKNAGAQVQANRVFSLLRRMFNWCLERDILAIHPMAGMKAPTKEKSRDRVLSHDELHAIWEAADEDGYPWGPMTRLLILTLIEHGLKSSDAVIPFKRADR